MKSTHIPFQQTGFFSDTMIDYLEKKESIQPFYHHFPDLDGFRKQIEEKKSAFSSEHRSVLVEALKDQYVGFDASELTLEHINLLQEENTFTITTGHQLNLFTGPLYFLYKIISVINLCEELSDQFPKQKFVPMYWMATEDHDFDEINFFNYKGTKVVWNRPDGGPVGRFSTDGLDEVFEEFSKHLGTSKNAEYIKELFRNSYLEHSTLSAATRYLANELFKKYGLVIIDADDEKLKRLFAPIVKDELLHQTSFKAVSSTIADLEQSYNVQVNPREINLFYMTDSIRERIVESEGSYLVNDTDIRFSKEEILSELEQHPERFSPNVIMRPLYQEVILPNLCYVGGGGEMAYWLELKAYFEKVEIPFPILLLRNSVQVISEKQSKKLKNLSISFEEIFLKQHELLSKKVKQNSDIQFSFEDAQTLLEQQFNALRNVAEQTDASFIGAVNAQQQKQLNGLENLRKRLLRAEKRSHADLVNRITELQNELLPNQSLEERQRNFSEYYLEYGETFISALRDSLKPLQLEFTILEAS
jgi:bacillithiol biosynthesis cysteine-adding enzyme BshC